MHYPIKKWWRLMAMVMEKREIKSVRYERRRERSRVCVISKTENLIVWMKWYRVWVSIYIKGNKLIHTPNPIKTEKSRQIRFGLVGYPRVQILLSCLVRVYFRVYNFALVKNNRTSLRLTYLAFIFDHSNIISWNVNVKRWILKDLICKQSTKIAKLRHFHMYQ